MPDPIRRQIQIALLCALAIAIGPATALAQSGSAGGSIGNDEKSVSGSRQAPRSIETEKPARRSKPEAEEPRRASRKSGGGGGGNFDGAWIVNSVGTTCSGSSTVAVVISSGRIIGQGVSGTVSANGSTSAVGNYDGVIVTSSGRTNGRNGSGTFRRSDGCVGTWKSSKQ